MYSDKSNLCKFILALALVFSFSLGAIAQDGGGGDDGDDTPPDVPGGGDFIFIDPVPAGVEISPEGIFRSKMRYDLSGNLDRLRAKSAQAQLDKKVQNVSSLRKISLNRLEAAYEKYKSEGKKIPLEMKYLAGLTRLTHVFYYPDSKDIVIAGPAEGFFHSSQDHVIGIKSGKAVLQLEDLIVALRAYAPNKQATHVIGCSIDPTQQGLANLKQAVAHTKNQVSANGGFNGINTNQITSYFQRAMGLQNISVFGVSPNTRFAQVLIDADYHMKLIGIGLEKPPVRISSFISKAKGGSTNSLQRWFFQPDYDYVKVNEDETAMMLDGGGVKLVGEDESVSGAGVRKRTGKSSRASRTFCSSFTKMYDALADKMPLYAELRNLVDISVAAAFIQEMDFYGQAGWDMNYFGDESKVRVEKFKAPTKVEPAINAVWKNGLLMTPIGGGVKIQPRAALSSDNMKTDESGSIDKTKRSITIPDLASGQWWWD